MPAPISSGRRPTRRERGAALLAALVSVAVLTAMAVDLAYSARVSLQIAANARDELRAHYLARSGVAMGRLVLSFQQKLDGAVGAAPGIPRVQLWNLVPVDQSLVEGLFAGAPGAGASLFANERPAAAPRPSLFATAATQPAAGTSVPTFDAQIDDEGRKVNAQLFGFIGGGDQSIRMRAQALYQLICDSRWDPLFDREDAHGQRYTREDVIVNLRDWVNDEQGSSTLVPGPGSTSAQCGLQINSPAFAKNFGDKNRPYDRGDDRYRTKNGKMDSLDELYLVAGIGDAFMAAFGDSLTIYADKMNVNTGDPQKLLVLARLMASPPSQPTLFVPEFAELLVKAVQERTLNGVLSITAKNLGDIVAGLGVTVNQALLADNAPNSPFTDRSTVFRIRATGKVGAVRSGVDAVVRLEAPNTQRLPGEQVAAPGRIIHWRED